MSARRLALSILNDIELHKSFAHIAAPAALSTSDLEARDKGLVTELVYGVLRNQLALDWLIDKFASRPVARIEPQLLNLLRLGVYQLVYLDKIPGHAAVDTSVDLAKEQFRPGVEKFVNAVLRSAARGREALPWPKRGRELTHYLSVFYSHPRWLVELWIDELGVETTEALLIADNKRPKVTLRANTIKTSPQALADLLRQAGIEAAADNICPEAIVPAGQNIPENIIADGLAYVQNSASIAVGHAIAPKKGESVIDFCAAPGGKATHLAQLMGDDGRVIAVDINASRLKLVEDNCRRLGVNIVKCVKGDATKSLSLPEVDHVLVDAPCSGLGVLARRPDSRWRKTAADIPRLAALQLGIVNNVAKHVKKGGTLTYSVCTISNAETYGVIEQFNSAHPDFRPKPVEIPGQTFAESPYARFWPHLHGTDGMFIAQWRRY
ncbi:MAG: 16S rRNA (cytosine(967)-C(5))-methyltransferase RsmB [Actinomycetota bacterium]|nr:16S rRNA (cytosine(967)-C(5))-methyltransferase RsmB [Actinomycetota bacterium]